MPKTAMRCRSARGPGSEWPGTSRDACGPTATPRWNWPIEQLPSQTGFDLAGSCNFLRPATGKAQQYRQEDDNHHKIEHGEPGAVSDIRSIPVHAVNETRHRVGGAARSSCRHVDHDVGE